MEANIEVLSSFSDFRPDQARKVSDLIGNGEGHYHFVDDYCINYLSSSSIKTIYAFLSESGLIGYRGYVKQYLIAHEVSQEEAAYIEDHLVQVSSTLNERYALVKKRNRILLDRLF